jgi:hypothetical protein
MAIKHYIGYDIPAIIEETHNNIYEKMKTTRKSIYNNIKLRNCPSKTCMDDTIIKGMVNRFNFDTYPAYPGTNNTETRDSIVRVIKVGTATSLECQLEIYTRTEFFTDVLYSPLSQDTKFYMRNYRFNLIPTSTNCKFKVTPFTTNDISNNRMDIANDAYALECPPAPQPCSSSITQSSSASYTWVTDEYKSPIINCNINLSTDPVLMLIKNMYNNMVIFTKNGINYYNTIHKITKSFSPRPNILEFKVTTQRVYWDNNYSIAYYTGKPNDPVEVSFLIVKWPEGTSYEVETGYYWKDVNLNFVDTPATSTTIIGGVAKSGNYTMCTPTIEEFFFPDLVFTANGIYKPKPDSSLSKVNLPYLANDGLTAVGQQQTKRFTCNPATCINTDGTAL